MLVWNTASSSGESKESEMVRQILSPTGGVDMLDVWTEALSSHRIIVINIIIANIK